MFIPTYMYNIVKGLNQGLLCQNWQILKYGVKKTVKGEKNLNSVSESKAS